MTLAAKIIASILGAGGVALLGCYSCGLIKIGEDSSATESGITTINWAPLTSDTDFANTYTGKVGEKYGMYFIGVIDSNNQKWWESSYQTYAEDSAKTGSDARSFSTSFSKDQVTSAYSTSDTKALNKVCEVAYKKTLTAEVDFSSPAGTENKHKLAADILRYCSPLTQLPVTIQENDDTYTGENMIGKQGHTKKLVKATGTENEKFWNVQNKWFQTQGNVNPQPDAYFGQFFEGEENAKTLKADKNIKQICEEAYKKEAVETATTEKPKIDDVVKYCSFIKGS